MWFDISTMEERTNEQKGTLVKEERKKTNKQENLNSSTYTPMQNT
jgi:hypothetical protein